MHIYISKQTILGSDNGWLPGRHQAIIWTNAGILLIGPLGTNFSEIVIGIQTFSFKKMHLKMSSAKWCPFCCGLSVLIKSQHWSRYGLMQSDNKPLPYLASVDPDFYRHMPSLVLHSMHCRSECMLSFAYSLTRASAFQIYQGPTSLSVMISQFKVIINHTQNWKKKILWYMGTKF